VTDDDCLDAFDSVHADHLGTCYDLQLTAVGMRVFKEAPPKASSSSGVINPEDNEDALAASQSGDSGRARGAVVAGDDEIDRLVHCVFVLDTAPPSMMRPLSVRKNASSCRNSTGFSRSGRNSVWPVAAAGARL